MYWSMMSMVPGIKQAICVFESPFTKTSNQRNLAKKVQVSMFSVKTKMCVVCQADLKFDGLTFVFISFKHQDQCFFET